MTFADELLSGPRGRRLCLSYLCATDGALMRAVFWLAHELDPNPGTLIRFAEAGAEVSDDPVFTEADVAGLIGDAAPAAISDDIVREAWCDAVDSAQYWREPDGTDAVAALPAVRQSLSAVAELLVAAMPNVAASSAAEQWAVDWDSPSESEPIERNPAAVLSQWTAAQSDGEKRADRHLTRDPRAMVSGSWWSVPTRLLHTRGSRQDALQLVEDSLGWEGAVLIPVRGSGRILEIASPADWAELCREFPMEVTASRRHDWFRVTGRDGRWLIPDWERVAQRWDAVHLTSLGYLSAATKLIDVDGEFASVIGGWGPDCTIWLADVARERDAPREAWRRPKEGTVWVRDEAGDPA